ncbi:energy coupling factor transporter S component ThiW [Streptococcus pneumoniae]|nr:energy coupling factor transporter S component ThiW [Streptococcus pneumoniae]
MRKHQLQVHKLTILSMMIALDVVLTPIFRIEGMAPMSSVVNILAGIMMGPVYALAMATVTAFIRMTTQGIPPLVLTGATFGALLAGLFYKYGRKFYFSALGEIVGTGIIGSIVSYPVMVLFTGSAAKLSWFIYTPRFFGATLIGTAISFIAFRFLIKQEFFKKVQGYFFAERIE